MIKGKFSIVTPTYNRGELLRNIYECLCRQTYKELEWIIIDDGSNDNTKAIVNEFIRDNLIDIKYHFKNNGGKHSAVNIGIDFSNGEYFVCLDSDDIMTDDALEFWKNEWLEYSHSNDVSNVCGIDTLCSYPNSEIIGSKFPENYLLTNSLEASKYEITGDKDGFILTEIIKKNKFPVIEGENFIPESIVWNKISAKYDKLCINKVTMIASYRNDGLTKNILKIRVGNPIGCQRYYKETLLNNVMNDKVSYRFRIRTYINYIRFSLHSKRFVNELVVNFKNIPITMNLFLFGGVLMYFSDKIRLINAR